MSATYEPDRRVIIYPAYLDRTKTVAEGRRITKENAVDSPLFPEIFEAALSLGLPAEIERAYYCRSDITEFGRIRVSLKDASGRPNKDEIPNRRKLFVAVAQAIAKRPDRVKRGGKPPVLVVTPNGLVMMEPKEAMAHEAKLKKEKEAADSEAMAQAMGGAGAAAGPSAGAGPSGGAGGNPKKGGKSGKKK